MEVRAKFYELLSHCIPPTVILKVCMLLECSALGLRFVQTVAERVVDKVDETLKPDIMHWAAIYVSVSNLLDHGVSSTTIDYRRSECAKATKKSTTSKHGSSKSCRYTRYVPSRFLLFSFAQPW